jgi:hypothetical protein
MQLAMTVFSVVLGVTIVLAIFGILIDRSAASDERNEGR